MIRKALQNAGLCRNLQPQSTLVGHLSPVKALAVSADSKTLVSGDETGIVNVWSLETGQLIRSLAAYPGSVEAILIAPDGKSIVTASLLQEYWFEDRWNLSIKVWNFQTGELIQSLMAKKGTIQKLMVAGKTMPIRISNSYEVKIEFLTGSIEPSSVTFIREKLLIRFSFREASPTPV